MNQTSASRTTRPKKRKGPSMAIIVQDVPPGINWGWYSREDPRMHLQIVDSKKMGDFKVWLEKEGKRVFEPVGKIPAKIRTRLEVEVNKRRRNVEGRWTNLMIKLKWLTYTMRGSEVTLSAYPQFPGSRFIRKFDLADYFPGIYDPAYPMTRKEPIKPDEVALNDEMAALEIWTKKDLSLREHIFLPTILWQD